MVAPKLPIVTIDKLQRLQEAEAVPVRRLPKPAFLLQRGPFRNRPEIMVLEPARGCDHRCAFCPTQAQQEVSDEPVSLIEGVSDWLSAEFSARSFKPHIVMVGPASDPFQPIPELQREVGRIIEILAERGVTSWVSTRGVIQADVLDVLERNRDHVRVTVSINTIDADIQRVLEPHASSPEERLKLVAELKRRKIPVEVALDPLIGGLTDTPNRLAALLQRLSALGVERVIAAYLVLRPGVKERLSQMLAPAGIADLVLEPYLDGPMLHDGQQLSRFLDKSSRQRGYALLMSLAAGMGISVRLGELANPDFRGPARFDAAHHVRSLQQRFRESEQPIRSPNAAGA